MTCDVMEARLAEILAGESAPDRDVEAHLLDCASCRRDFETARAGWTAAERLAAPKTPEALVRRVRRRIAAFQGGGFFRWATAAAAALLVSLLAFQLVPVRTPRSEAPPVVRRHPPAATEPVALMAPEAGIGSLVAQDLDGRPVGDLSIARHSVQVEILDGISKTTIEEVFFNETNRRLEGTFYFPLPPNASISRLAMEIEGRLIEGVCLERERAREVYEGIVRRMQDPALLEWMPGGVFKCRIFPIEPRSEKRIILSYTQALPMKAGKTQYVYPLASEKTRSGLGKLTIDFAVKFGARIRTVRCRTHAIDIEKKNEHEARGSFEAHDARARRDFVLDIELDPADDFVFLPHKIDGQDGWFLVAYTPHAEARPSDARHVAVVVDCSASVNSKELAAAVAVVDAVRERFPKVTIFAHDVDARKVTREELAAIETGGASNVKKAFEAAIAERPDEIIYVGEGVPTAGPSAFDLDYAGTIRTVAVGSDAAAPLLEDLARRHGGVSFSISPSDDVAARVREIADGLATAVIRDVAVESTEQIYDLAPAGRRHCLAGERLVVTGRWRGTEATLSIGGRDFPLAFPVKQEQNNYVKRLWAQRKIGDLLADESKKSQCIQLSTEYQVMTPFTSFLVLENEKAYEQYGLRHNQQRVDDHVLALKPNAPAKELLTDGKADPQKPGRSRTSPSFAESVEGFDELQGQWNDALWLRRREFIGGSKAPIGPSAMDDFEELEQSFRKLGDMRNKRLSEERKTLQEVERTMEKLAKAMDVAISGRIAALEPSRVTLDIGRNHKVQTGMLFAVTRDKRFIAVLLIREVQERTSTAEIWQGIQVSPMLVGDTVAFIPDPDTFLRLLPDEVLLDLASQKNVERMNRMVQTERALGK